MKRKPTGWILRKDGWHKTGRGGVNQLTNNVFNRPEPIVRDDHGRPMSKDRSSIDIARWIQEVNERDGHHG